MIYDEIRSEDRVGMRSLNASTIFYFCGVM